MSAPSVSPIRLHSLTGYRVILAVAIFVHHALTAARFFTDDFVNGLGLIAPYAHAALSSFFVLSGFVLAWAEPARDTVARFWRRRVVRIFPSQIATWALTLGLLAVFGSLPLLGGWPGTGPAVANLFLVQAWIPDPDYVLSVDGINWSVSCELFFYLLFPFLIPLLRRIPAQRLGACFFGVVIWLAAVPALITVAFDGPAWPLWPPLSFVQTWLVYFFPLGRLPEFLLGVLLALIVQAGRWPRLRAQWVALFAVLVWLATWVLPAAYSRSGILAVPFCLFIPIIAARDLEGRPTWLAGRHMVRWGNVTYAFYLLHWPMLAITRYLVGVERTFDVLTGTVIIVAVFVATQAGAYVLYRYLELPLMHRFSSPRSKGHDPALGRPPA
ncbi:MAG: acyltransferase family protein [Pseudonocardiaceae bacterium]